MKYRLWIIFTIGVIIAGSFFSISHDPGGALGDVHAALPAAVMPTANFTGDPTEGAAPLNVQFSDESTGSPTGWTWYFGDEAFDNPWTEIKKAAEWQARAGHSSVVLPDGSIVLMGGQTGGNTFRSDVWRSIDQGATWEQMTPAAQWSARRGHTSVALPDGSIVLMGGWDGGSMYFNDVWYSDDKGETWMQMTPDAPWNARRGLSCVALPDGGIVLMGGGGGYAVGRFNDVWHSVDDGATWTQKSEAADWPVRQYHNSLLLPDGSIILMGGYDGNIVRSDVWRSVDQGATWTLMTGSAGWARAKHHTSVVLPDGSIILMEGDGYANVDNNLKSVWRSTDQGASWQFLRNKNWERRSHYSSVVLHDGSIVVMGGWTGILSRPRLNDVWRLETAGSSEQHPTHTYSKPGTYSVALQVYNADGFSSLIRDAYITVTDTSPTPEPTPDPTPDPTPGPTPTVGPAPDPGAHKIYLPLLVR